MFFGLPASRGFLLAGGAALVAQRLTERPTQDLDFFGAPEGGNVTAVRDELEAAVREAGWFSQRIKVGPSFCRLVITADEDLLVDITLDSPPNHPPTVSIAGPTFDPEELAARKVLALFGRAEARDFADVYVLVQRYPKNRLLAQAAETDPGFDQSVFRQMLGTLTRFVDAEIPIAAGEVAALRAFFTEWAAELG